MIYRVLYNGVDIYGDSLESTLINPNMETELNAAGSLEFTVPPGHSLYDAIGILTSDVEVIEDNEVVWFGRPISVTKNWNNEKVVSCEGALSYFNDTVQTPHQWDAVLVSDFFRHLITVHNTQVEANRQFTVGNITIDDVYVYRKLEYDTTFDCLQNMCLDAEGGYLFLRRENNVTYIDWLKDVPYQATQPVQFAVNLLDISQSLDGADICTIVLPLGAGLSRVAKVNELTSEANIYESRSTSSEVVGSVQQGGEVTFDFIDGDDTWYRISSPFDGYGLQRYLTPQSGDVPLSISHVNGGVDTLEDADAIAQFGRITKIQQWSNVHNANELKEKGLKWLQDEQYDKLSIEVDAAELHYLDPSYEAFKVGQKVHVTSNPHLLDKDLPMTKISVSLDSGIKKIQIGTPPHKTLTEIYKDS